MNNGGAEYSLKVKAVTDLNSFNQVSRNFQTMMSTLKAKSETLLDGEAEKAEIDKVISELTKLENAYQRAFEKGVGSLNISKFNKELGKIDTDSIVNSFKVMGTDGKRMMNAFSASLLSTNTQLKRTKTMFDEMATTMMNTIKWGISSSALNTFTGAVSEAYSYVKNLDKSLNDIRIVSQKSAKDMEVFAKHANSAAQNLGSTTLDYSNAALIYYQQGLAEEEVNARTNTTVKMANVLGVTAEEVSNYMTAVWNNFDDGSKSLEYYADVITKLGAATASSAEEISTGLEKFAAVADTVGLSYEYATAALATVTSETRQSADVVGTAFKTLFARIQDLELGETLEDGVTLGKYSEALATVGIAIKDGNGELRNMDDILDDMGKKWDTLSKAQQVSLAQTVAGTRQYTQLIALMDNWDVFSQNLETAYNATGELTKEQAIYMESTEAHLKSAQAAWDEFKESILDSSVINWFAHLSKLTGNLATLFTDSIGGGMPAFFSVLSLASKNMSATFAEQTVKMKRNRGLPEDNELKTKEMEATKTWLSTLYGISGEKNKLILQQKERMLNVSRFMEKEQEEEINLAISREAELQNEISLWKEKVKQAEKFIKITDNAQAMSSNAIEQIDSRDVESYKKFDKGFSLNAGKKGQLVPEIHENFEESKEMLANLSARFNEWKNSAESASKFIDKQTKNLAGLDRTTEDGIKDSLAPARGIKDESKTFIKQWKSKGEMASYRKIFNSVDMELTKSITARVNNLEEKVKKELTEAKINSGKVDDKIVGEIQKEVGEIQKDIDKIITKSEAKMKAVSDTINTENASTKIISDQQELDKNTDTVNQKLSEFEEIATSEAWYKFAGSIGQIGTGMWSLGNAVLSLGSDSLTPWEKFMRLLTGSTMGIMSMVSGYNTLATTIPIVASAIKDQTLAQKILNASTGEGIVLTLKYVVAKGLEIIKTKLQVLWETILALVRMDFTKVSWLAVAALAAVAGALVYGAVKLAKYASEEAQLKRQIEATTEALDKAKEGYKELKEIIDGYKDSRTKIDELKEGTVEFYEAIIAANEYAEKLIETLNLLPSQYTIGEGGLIQINEDTLDNAAYSSMQEVHRRQAAQYSAQARLQKYYADEKAMEFNREVNTLVSLQDGPAFLSKEMTDKILENQDAKQYKLGDISKGPQVTVTDDEILDRYKRWGKDREVADVIEKVMDTSTGKIVESVDKNAINISDAVESSMADYNLYQAKAESYQKAAARSNIYGYLNKDQIGKYDKLSQGSQDAINTYMANQTEKQKGAVYNDDLLWEWEHMDVDSDKWKWWNPFDWGSALVGGKKVRQEKEEYLKETKGYKKDKNGVWKDKDNNIIDPEQIDKEIKGLNITDVIRAKNSGAYNTDNIYKEQIEPVLQTAQDIIDKKGLNETSGEYITEGLLRLKAGTADEDFFNKLTDEEKKALSVTGAKFYTNEDGTMTEKAIVNGVETDYTQQQIHEMLALSGGDGRSVERQREDLEKYKNTLEATAEELGTTSKSLEFFGEAMYRASGEINDYTKESAQAIAKQYKFNKTYNDAVGVYYDNEDAIKAYAKAIKKGEDISYDLADAMGELAEALEDMGLSLSAETITDKLPLVQKLLTGTEEEAQKAYQELYKLGQIDTLESFFGKTQDLTKYTYSYQQIVDEINRTKIDGNLAAGYSEQLIKMIKDTELTVDQINQLADQLKIEIPVTYDTSKQFNVNTVSFTTKAQSVAHRYTGEMPNPAYDGTDKSSPTIEVDYAWVETTEPKTDTFTIPEDAQLKVKETAQSVGKGGFKQSLGNQGKKNGGSKPKKEKKIEDPKDRYHDINIELKQIANELQKVQDEQDNLVGSDLIANLQRQYNLLNKEIDATAEKIGIARGEQEELQGKLASNGVRFNSDGTIANYAQAWEAELAHVNNIINKYNSMTADGQEKYQETLDNAKERWNKFKENINRYDTLITDEIPGLEADIREALDQQIEIKLEAFEYEIQIRLDMSEAERDWNEFKKKIIDGIKEEDILGNAKAKLADVSSYYKNDGTGEIQSATKHVNNILAQLKQMDADRAASAYGETYTYINARGEEVTIDYNNRKQALEDLKEYYSQIMNSMMDLQELEEEIHESYLDMMDEAQEKFDKQLETYQTIDEIIQHDMNLVKLMYGDSASLAEYYTEQRENLNDQLDFQKQQVAFWRNQMDTLEEGSEAWEKAKENWMAAGAEWRSLAETNLQVITDQYLDSINTIFENLNNNVTNGMGLDYISKEWDLINQNADRYLDQVNSIYEVQSLQNKYLDAIEKSTNPTQQKKLNDLMQDEIDLLQEKDKLSQYDLDRANLKYEIAMKQMELEESQQKKTQLRLRRDSQGNYTYQYTNDDSEVAKLQQELSDLYNQLYNLDAGQYKSNLDELYSVWEAFQADMYEAAQINDPEERKARELMLEEQYSELINGITADNESIKANLQQSTMSQLFDLYDQNAENYNQMTEQQRSILDQYLSDEMEYNGMAFDNLFNLYNKNLENFNTMTDEQKNILMNDFIPQWNSGVQQMVDSIIGEGGFAEVTKAAIEEIRALAAVWDAEREAAYTEAIAAAEALKTQVSELAKDNTELIDTYDKELEAIQGVIDKLEEMQQAYKDAAEEAKKAAEEAYNYWQAASNKAASTDTKIDTDNYKKPDTDANDAKKKPNTTPPAPSLSIGSTVSVKPGTRWYADSWGGGASGLATGGKIAYINASGSHAYNINGAGWIKKTDIVGYDTGGYTGEWNNEDGRIAMLHQKELVLNENDTKNILNAVEILRNITSNLGATLLNQISAITANNTSAIANAINGSETLEQNVHIDAQFPNVKDSREIETALNNLVNMASQHIQKN